MAPGKEVPVLSRPAVPQGTRRIPRYFEAVTQSRLCQRNLQTREHEDKRKPSPSTPSALRDMLDQTLVLSTGFHRTPGFSHLTGKNESSLSVEPSDS